MPCIFCRSNRTLTNEHVFPAFMGGTLEVRNGSCTTCNGDFGKVEAQLKDATRPLLNLLKIKNRKGIVPTMPVTANIRGLDMRDLPAFVDEVGQIQLLDTVKESTTDDGRRLRSGFFLTKEAGDKFAKRADGSGAQLIERKVPEQIIIDVNYLQGTRFAFSLTARKVAAKIALAATAYEYGIPFALSPEFDAIREAKSAKGGDLRVWILANEGLMAAHLRSAHQHSVLCYLSAEWKKAWAIVTLFGGLSYRVDLSTEYLEREKQFSIFYDAVSKKRTRPIVLADEKTLVGHMLSPATTFENRDAVDAQWYPIVSSFCKLKGIEVERVIDEPAT